MYVSRKFYIESVIGSLRENQRKNQLHLQSRRFRSDIKEAFLTIQNFYNPRTRYQEVV